MVGCGVEAVGIHPADTLAAGAHAGVARDQLDEGHLEVDFPERAQPELKGVEAEPETEPGPELRAAERTLMAPRFLFSPDSFSLFLGIS